MRARKKSAAEKIAEAKKTRGPPTLEDPDVNDELVLRPLQPCTERNYVNMQEFWDAYEGENPGAKPYVLSTSKHFMKTCVSCWRKGISVWTVYQRWSDFIAGWQRRPGECQISSQVTKSIYNYILGHLKETYGLSTERRIKTFLTPAHFTILVEHKWQKDWYQPDHPAILVIDHALDLSSIYTSSRLKEYVNLRYKDLEFGILRNQRGEATIGVVPTRDAKGFAANPSRRPKHGLYEDIEPLFANPVLPFLAIALAFDAFQDYHTQESIFDILPPRRGTVKVIKFRKDILEEFFFQRMDGKGATGKAERAASYHRRKVELGHRAGYETNITTFAARREAQVRVEDDGYGESARMIFAGHNDRDVFRRSYASSLAVDGMASYWKKRRDTELIESFRGMSLQWHPSLIQSLPAKVQDDLRRQPDFIALSEELKSLGEKVKDLTTESEIQLTQMRRAELISKRRQLMSEELTKWQRIQSDKELEDSKHNIASKPTLFNRIRYLDPLRDRLASSLFLNATLRSEDGRRALHDMIALCTEKVEVAYRPSSQPENGCCPVCGQEMD
ncbi:hypothetical protein F5884DRAFT_874658, partial [Xylogone sp. PMI_703]